MGAEASTTHRLNLNKHATFPTGLAVAGIPTYRERRDPRNCARHLEPAGIRTTRRRAPPPRRRRSRFGIRGTETTTRGRIEKFGSLDFADTGRKVDGTCVYPLGDRLVDEVDHECAGLVDMFERILWRSVRIQLWMPRTTRAGSSLNTLKNENGAALTIPSGPTVVTKAVGRATTSAARSGARMRMVSSRWIPTRPISRAAPPKSSRRLEILALDFRWPATKQDGLKDGEDVIHEQSK
jgi:hypothetical protein